MSFDPNDPLLADFLNLCEHKLIHLTDEVIENGIQPSSISGIQVNISHFPPRPGCVYLSCFGSSASVLKKNMLIVDADKLDPSLFRVDEDRFFAAYTWKLNLYEPQQDIPESIMMRAKGQGDYLHQSQIYDPQWFNDVQEQLDTPEQVLRSLAEGSCAYAGTIPQSAISEIIELKPSDKWKYFQTENFRTRSKNILSRY
ncbi:hypothetical protein [Canibacter oris]|uniref:Uncharacterized protein n=1 Tax=Canibacter oris TaxID=1365628 RepID=A0A840DD64_9MICO|nr:hypothetical protein [Canibacter oris]MBB4071401.1 hypothetical protein [Canibacter oris]